MGEPSLSKHLSYDGPLISFFGILILSSISLTVKVKRIFVKKLSMELKFILLFKKLSPIFFFTFSEKTFKFFAGRSSTPISKSKFFFFHN